MRRHSGKPKSASDATHMLRRLSGATHEVITAVSVWMVSAEAVDPALAADDDSGNISLGFRTFCDTSRVTFHELTDERIREYLACGESYDKDRPSRRAAREGVSRPDLVVCRYRIVAFAD